MLHDTIKCKTDDPNRCQGRDGDCHYLALENCTFCAACGGGRQLEVQNKQRIRTYRLAKFQARLDDFATHPDVKGLREEIGILRIMMEERLNSLKSPLEIMAHTHTISDLCMKIERLVTSCHKMEKSMGKYLDKNNIVQFGMEIVQIITRHVDDGKAIDNIAGDLSILIERMLNESDEEIT